MPGFPIWQVRDCEQVNLMLERGEYNSIELLKSQKGAYF